MNFIKKSNAQLFLFINAILWGSLYVWSDLLLAFLPRFTILLLCSLGGLAVTAVIFFSKIRGIKAEEILPSLIVTALSIISNTFFMLALQYTSSSNTAFIVQSSVVITPVIMVIIEKRMPDSKVIICAFISLAGLFLITCSFTDFRFNMGDIFAFCNALFFSLFLIGQRIISVKVSTEHFSFLHYLYGSLIFLLLAGFIDFPNISLTGLDTYKFILPALANIIIAIVTVLFQSQSIRYVKPESAVLIYMIEPLVALVLGSILIGGQLKGIQSVIGFVLVMAAVFLSVVKLPVRKDHAKSGEESGKY
jgi:drug/metabolite transporter (DMT)-like permease